MPVDRELESRPGEERATSAVRPALAGPRLREVARGTVLDRYVVLEPIGFGGMGQVYAAYDPDLDRKVAVKLLHQDAGGGGSGGCDRLLREAQAMARLSHPNVVAVHDVGLAFGKLKIKPLR